MRTGRFQLVFLSNLVDFFFMGAFVGAGHFVLDYVVGKVWLPTWGGPDAHMTDNGYFRLFASQLPECRIVCGKISWPTIFQRVPMASPQNAPATNLSTMRNIVQTEAEHQCTGTRHLLWKHYYYLTSNETNYTSAMPVTVPVVSSGPPVVLPCFLIRLTLLSMCPNFVVFFKNSSKSVVLYPAASS